MKAAEIQVGGHYLAKVSGRVVRVRVTAIRTVTTYNRRERQVYDVCNLTTGRHLAFKSAAKFRSRAGDPAALAAKLVTARASVQSVINGEGN